MKKTLIVFFALSLFMNLHAQTNEPYSLTIRNWDMQTVSLDNYYPTYMADPLGVRFCVSSQFMKYSNIDHSDQINLSGNYQGKLVIIPGVKFSLFRFSPKSNPNLGIEIELGASTPMFMRMGNHDLTAMDGIYTIGIAGRPAEWLDLRFVRHHICTHLGDEIPDWAVSPTDYDYNLYKLPVTDDFIASAALRPLYFLGNPQLKEALQIYGDFGFYLPGKDFMGERQNKPHKEAYLSFQGGAELEYYIHKHAGGIFSAYNVSAYQTNAFSPNQSFSLGYIFPQHKDKKKIRVGLNWYNGRSWANQFYMRKEKFTAFFVEADI